jgi:Concanavalin A-like lectin/glucanases superfamily
MSSLIQAVYPYLKGSLSIAYETAPTGNTAFNFTGVTGSYLNFGTSNPALYDHSTSSFFVEAWVNFTQNAYTEYIIGVLNIAGGTSDDWGFRCDGTNKTIMFYHYNTGNAGTSVSASTPLITGTWYHVAANVTTGGTIYLFINGVLQNAGGTSIGGVPRSTAGVSLFVGTPSPLPSGWVATYGYIQDVRVIKGGTGPTATFTPQAVPWTLAQIPTYVSGGTNVMSLSAQYLQRTNFKNTVGSVKALCYHS